MEHVMMNELMTEESVEMAAQALLAQAGAAAGDQNASLLLTMDGVRVATLDYPGGLPAERLQPVQETIEAFVASGGNVWLCRGCGEPTINSSAVVTALVDGGHMVAFQPSWFGARVAASLN